METDTSVLVGYFIKQRNQQPAKVPQTNPVQHHIYGDFIFESHDQLQEKQNPNHFAS